MNQQASSSEFGEMIHCARQLLIELLAHSHSFIRDKTLSESAPDLPPEDKALYFQIIKSQTYLGLALTFCKYSEFHARYRRLLSPELAEKSNAINSRIKKSKILDLRNKFVGHLLDAKTGKPLPPQKIGEYYGSILGPDTEDQFNKWWWSSFSDRHSGNSMAATLFQIMCSSGR